MTGKVVLLIEGDAGDRQVHAEMLRFVGFRVQGAATVEAGVEVARSERPELIFLDLGTPDEAAWQSLRRLREDPVTEAIPVAVLTAVPLDEAQLQAAGLCGQVERPVRPYRLVEEAERCLGPADESLPEVERMVEDQLG